MRLSLGSRKRERGMEEQQGVPKSDRNQKRHRDRPFGDTVWHGEKRRYLFQLEKFDLFEGLLNSLDSFGAST